MHVRIHGLGELVWVAAEALDWKGRRGWEYGHVCQNMQVRRAGVGGGHGCWSGELVWVVAVGVGQGSWCGWWLWVSVRGAGVGGGCGCRSGELVMVVAKWALGQWAMC